jgi:hypothetical protein
MAPVPIPDDVRCFILASIASVPYLEAMLLLRNEPEHGWDIKRLAPRLYVSDKTARNLLSGLCNAGVLIPAGHQPLQYRYHPDSDQLREMIDRLADAYSTNLVDVTDLIHSGTGTKARQFTGVFKRRRDS